MKPLPRIIRGTVIEFPHDPHTAAMEAGSDHDDDE
jgi:hypothetical protein